MPCCPLCNERVDHFIRAKAYLGDYSLEIWECLNCNLAFQFPQPSVEQSIEYMNWRYSSKDPQDRYITDKKGKLKIFREKLFWIKCLKVPNNRILDVGSGNGAFVKAAAEVGYDVVGTETCPEAVKLAKEMFDVNLVYGNISSVPIVPNYGIVTLWDVIEHLPDPLSMLRQILDRTAKNGLLIVETCNWSSLSRRFSRGKWSYYLYSHFFYFSPKSLKTILYRAGYTDVRLYDCYNPDLLLATGRKEN